MKNSIYLLLLLLSFALFQCSSDQVPAEEETTEETTEAPAEPPPAQVAQQPETNISPSQILEDNADRYAVLHQKVVKNKETIMERIQSGSYPQKLKDGLQATFDDVALYDNVTDIAQKSKNNSAETIVQLMDGLDMYLAQWDIE